MEKQVSEGSLHKWFKGSKSKDGKGGWVNVVTGGTCASDEPGEGTPKCVSSAKRASMTKAERLSAARRKKKADPGQQQKSGAAKPTYVSTDKPKKKKMKESYTRSLTPLTEKAKKCWPGYEKKGTKKMFGKTYNNCVKKEEVEMEAVNAAQQAAIAIAKKKKKEDDMVAKKKKEKMYAGYEPQGETIEEADKKGKGSGTKDACYHKVKSRYSVWPSAYASGALVKCRKVGAANWGNSSKKEDFSDWKSEFIWEDGDSSKKLEEKKKLGKGGDPFKKNPRLVDQAFDKIDGLIPIKKIKKELPTDVNEEMTELEKIKNAIKTKTMNGKPLTDKQIEGLKAGLTQGGNKVDESVVEFGKKVYQKTKEFINKPIIEPTINQKDYQKRVKDRTTNQLVEPKIKKEEVSNWRDELEEDWQKTNRQDKTDGMSQKAVNAYRRENPGSKLKTAVTQKPSTLKRGSKKAKRRKSFCSRMKGMKKRLTSAKTARDPDSRINKALRRWNC